jgi:hypothetical protein
MRRIAIAAALGALALTGCGDDDDEPAAAPETSLRVTVRADGPDGAARTDAVDCRAATGRAFCRDLTAKQLAPVPRDVACTQIFGGPATATVRGTLHGEPVNATFDLSNGCEIARWRRNAALLGQPPGNPPGG